MSIDVGFRVSRMVCVLLLLAAPALAQERPTKTPTASTPAQQEALAAAVKLHDGGRYDEAIAAYGQILDESPANVEALYELAFSYAAKEDFAHSIETARRGAEYELDLLPLFYDVMAFSLDATGEPQQAIDAYKQGLALEANADLYYNMGVTYLESLKDPASARGALEQAVALDPQQADAQLLLGQVFQTGGYTTPAVLALSRYLIVDPAGRTSLQGYGLWRMALRGGMDRGVDGLVPMPAIRPAPTDEGDFAAVDEAIALSHMSAAEQQSSGGAEVRGLVAQVDRVFGLLQARAAGGTFIETHYVPYFAELRRRDFVEPFVYWVSQRSPMEGVVDWLNANRDKVQAFLEWNQGYRWPN